ncbi:alpha/beta fold hydrolase [Actinoplanes sp. ATCC 53533]|uniref:alpha/beta fold hydrolase n=1 Tax=Actinoplanes sp. ATCC 53533 TaxID=1288362 RepID=UPI000F7783CA|nr:alpha/beta fold hydrolase [Actinoplanes sp. ATCC 53533]
MHYEDWGARSVRWAGIRSERVYVHGTDVHLLRADAGRQAADDAPVHLLIHPMAAGATLWLDTIEPLTALGPVIAPDLPGAVLGETRSPHRAAVEAAAAAEFLHDLTTTLDLRDIVLHGWSFGGLITVLFAARHPERIARVILVAPALPAPLSPGQRLAWRTLGAGIIATAPVVTRALVKLAAPRLIGMKQRLLASRADATGGPTHAGIDLTRVSPELRQLLAEQLGQLRAHPDRLNDGVTAFASAVRSMYVNRAPVLAAVDRLAIPTMLAWAEGDQFIERPMIDALMARRPDWHSHIFPSGGHLPPMESPAAYVDTLSRWLSSSSER